MTNTVIFAILMAFLGTFGLSGAIGIAPQQESPPKPVQPVKPSPGPVTEPAEDEAQGMDVETDEKRKSSFWMEQKLRLSTEILAGLVEANFERIGKNANLMRGLNRIETFIRREPAGYGDELSQFNSANAALIKAANQENIEAATLAFNRLTISCVSCHQHLQAH